MNFFLSQSLRLYWRQNLRAEPCKTLHAADASPSGAGGCSASTTQEDWLALCDVAEEGSTCVLIRKAKNHRATCRCAACSAVDVSGVT